MKKSVKAGNEMKLNTEWCKILGCNDEDFEWCETKGDFCGDYERVLEIMSKERERIIEEIETLQLDELDENWLKHFIRGKEGCPLKVE